MEPCDPDDPLAARASVLWLVGEVRWPDANTRYTAAGRRAGETMPPEAVLSFGTLVLQGLTVLVAVWATCTARRSLKVAVSPQIECFLRQQEASPVVDFVIQNTGSGNAHNVTWEIEADEKDFKSHVGTIGPPLKKAVP